MDFEVEVVRPMGRSKKTCSVGLRS